MVKKKKKMDNNSGFVYVAGAIGALVYYLQQATTVWEGVIGLIKAIVWPGLLIYKLLGFLGM